MAAPAAPVLKLEGSKVMVSFDVPAGASVALARQGVFCLAADAARAPFAPDRAPRRLERRGSRLGAPRVAVRRHLPNVRGAVLPKS